MQFNFIGNAGYGFPNAHGDWVQVTNTGSVLASATFSFNAFFQNAQPGGGASQGISISSANQVQLTTTFATTNNNVLIAQNTETVNYEVIANTPEIANTPTIQYNFCDPTGTVGIGTEFFVGNFNGGSSTGPTNGSGNYDMTTGLIITLP